MADEMGKMANEKRLRQLTIVKQDKADLDSKTENIMDINIYRMPYKIMKLVERIQLKRSAPLYQLCHLSKNLYNQAQYLIKTAYENERKWMRYRELDKVLKGSENYQTLPAQTAQQVLKVVDTNWKSFFKAIKDWKVNPEKYFKKPEPPKYKPKEGENLVVFTNQQCKIKDGVLWFPKKANLDEISVNTRRVTELNQVRILPRGLYYTVEIVYERKIEDYHLPRDRIIAIDLGLNNVVAVVNNVGLRPFVIKGGAIKSINQYYNKRRAELQSLKEQQGVKQETKRLQRLTRKRNNMITDLFHKISRALINYCLAYRIGVITIGYNALWKQKCNMGKRNNQNFISIPFQTLIQQIQYKAALIGIAMVHVEEAHTSKCSFVDNEAIERHNPYVGQRGVYNPETKKLMRGLFKTQEGKVINSDINGAYNILRKAFPKAITADGIEGLGLVPYSVKLAELNQWRNLNTSAQRCSKVSERTEIRGEFKSVFKKKGIEEIL